MTLIFGHRGAAGTFPENTMPSFQEAARLGANGIELDVQMTKDGTIVVIHDETVDRTTNGSGAVLDYTYDELSKLDASHTFSAKTGFCAIPTLEEVLQWLSKTELLINIEFKNKKGKYRGLEEELITLVRKYGLESRTVFSSFSQVSIMKCRELAPDIETALLYKFGVRIPWMYAKRLGANAIHPNYRYIAAPVIWLTMLNNIAVRPYTVNDEEALRKLGKLGISAVITDYPERAVRVLREKEEALRKLL